MVTLAAFILLATGFGEPQVQEAVEQLVSEARWNGAPFAPLVACHGAGHRPDRPRLRPCVLPADTVRIEGVGEKLRRRFGTDHDWVLDWVKVESEGRHPTIAAQVKIRSTEPPDLLELRFVGYGERLLVADVGGLRLGEEATPRLAPEPAAKAALERLLVGPDDERVAGDIVCNDLSGGQLRCRISDARDAAHATATHDRLRAFVRRVGETGWGIVGYREVRSGQGSWHMVTVGYELDDERKEAVAAFREIDGLLVLGDLIDWP